MTRDILKILLPCCLVVVPGYARAVNLKVSTLEMTPQTPLVGEGTIAATVCNADMDTAPTATVDFYVGGDPHDSATLAGLNGCVPVTMAAWYPSLSGLYEVRVVLDAGDAVVESNESDNERIETFRWYSACELGTYSCPLNASCAEAADGEYTCYCAPPYTGDGTVDCLPLCGDGVVLDGEPCDDNNIQDNDGCSAHCNVEAGWTCYNTEPTLCFRDPGCGNGVLDVGEECDDGNNTGGDGCSARCAVEEGFVCFGYTSRCHQTGGCRAGAASSPAAMLLALFIMLASGRRTRRCRPTEQ